MSGAISVIGIVASFIRDYVAGRATVHFDGQYHEIRIVDEERQYYQQAIILFAIDPTGDHVSAGFLIAGGWESSPSLHDPDFDLLPWISGQLKRLLFDTPSGFGEEAWLNGTWHGAEDGDREPPDPAF